MVEPVSTTIAAVALAVSAYAAEQNRKQARVMEVQAKALSDLQYEGERPPVEVSAERIGTEVRLVVTNAGLDPVDSVDVRLVAVKDNVRTRSLDTQLWNGGPLAGFQSARTSISLAGLDAGQVAVGAVRTTRGAEQWPWKEAYVPIPMAG